MSLLLRLGTWWDVTEVRARDGVVIADLEGAAVVLPCGAVDQVSLLEFIVCNRHVAYLKSLL